MILTSLFIFQVKKEQVKKDMFFKSKNKDIAGSNTTI